MKAGTIARGVAATMMAGAAVFALVCVITPHNVQLEALKGEFSTPSKRTGAALSVLRDVRAASTFALAQRFLFERT